MGFSLSDLSLWLAVYPFVMRALYLLRQSWEPLYMNSTCLMDLVRISAPEHYALHPTWKYYQMASNETCESISGVSIEQYFLNMYQSGTTEYNIFWGVLGVLSVVSSLIFLQRLVQGKVTSIVGVIACAVLSWNQGSLFHLLSHYQNDISHLNGNVMHHSNFSVGGDNAALVNTLPPGLIINFLQNYFTVYMMMWVTLDYFKLDKWTYLALSSPLIMAKFILQMKIIHPYIHTQHTSWYGKPISYFMDDYKGHVLCHHVSGYCLGDSPVYSFFYDAMLYVHGKVYELGYIRFKSVTHYAANIALDYFLLATVLMFLFITVAVMSPFLPKALQKDSAAAGKASKVKSH